MVRAGFGVRMKMPPPLLPPLSGSNPRFSSTTRYIPSRKPRDFFGEPPTALSCVRRPPPPLMSQKPLLPPSALKPRFFPPRDAMNDFPTPLLRMRMTPRIGFGLKRNPVGGPVPRPRLAKMNAPGIRGKSLDFSRFPQTPKAVRTGEVVLKSKKKGKKKKKTYTLTKEKSLKKPWVNETLKTEIEKKFALLEEAKTKNEPPAWNAYLQQKKLVDDINQALRLEYLGNRPDVEVSKATGDDVGVLKSNQNVVTDGDAVVECTENKKDEILENEFPYYCETCDRGFLNMNLFSEHKSQHITCGKEGCSFTGHPKIVEKHYMMQHRTGLFNRIVKGNSPEEIQKWITERKKHFPTKEKIEEKQAQRTEMDKRGERYVERQKSFNSRNNNFKSGSNNRFNKNVGGKQPSHKFKAFGKRGTFPRNKNTSEGSETKQKKREPIATDEEDCVVRNLPPFKGTAYYLGLQTDGSVITDEDSVSIASEYSDNCSDFINDCEDNMNGENVIAEMEKNSNDFIQEPDTECDVDMEADCLDKHFKCNDISSIDIGICDDKSENVDRITVGDKDIPSTFLVDNENVTFSRMNIAPSVDSPKIAEKPQQNVNNSLALIQCYDSEDDSDKDDTTDVKNCNQSSAVPEPSLKDDDDSGPEECSSKPRDSVVEIDDKLVNSNENGDSEKSNESKKRKRKRRRDSKSDEDDVKNSEKSISEDKEDKMPQVFHTRKRYRPPTLLEKLLSQEIKHERNTILQCVRYVVQSNYFNIGSSK